MKFVFCAGGTRSAMEAQLTDEAAIRLEAIFLDFPLTRFQIEKSK